MDRRRAGATSASLAMVDGTSSKAGRPEVSFPERQREAAEYLADMILELRNLARTVQLHTIMVPLEFAYYEAFGFANRVEIPAHEVEHIKALVKAGEDFDRDAGRPGS